MQTGLEISARISPIHTSTLFSRTWEHQGWNAHVSLAACSTREPQLIAVSGFSLPTLLLSLPFHSHTYTHITFGRDSLSTSLRKNLLWSWGTLGCTMFVTVLKQLHNVFDLVKKWGTEMPQQPEWFLLKEASWKPANAGRRCLSWFLQFITSMNRLEL